MLGLGPSSICEHKRLLRDERWNELAELFRKDFVDLYQVLFILKIDSHSLFVAI